MSKRNKTTHIPSEASKPAAPNLSATALDQLMGEIRLVPDSDIRRVTFDVPRGVSIAMSAHKKVAAFRSQFLENVPNMPIKYLDHLDKYAMAAWHAHLLAQPKPVTALEVLKKEAQDLRLDLMVAAEPLAHKGYFTKDAVSTIKEGTGNIDLANDVVALSALFSANWEKIKTKTTVEWAQVERASVLGPELLVALGEKLGYAGTPTEAEMIRSKAVTLFLKAYDEVERGLTFLRWHEEDVRDFLPSVYATGRNSRRSASAESEVEPTTGVPEAIVVPVTPVAVAPGTSPT